MNPFLLADGGAGLLILGFPVALFALGIFLSIFWIWMLIDAIANPRLRDTEKLIWVLVVLLLHILGAAIYFFVGRNGSTGGSPVA